jgi:hypothetical protein
MTVAALIALNRPDQLRSNLARAHENGVAHSSFAPSISQNRRINFDDHCDDVANTLGCRPQGLNHRAGLALALHQARSNQRLRLTARR